MSNGSGIGSWARVITGQLYRTRAIVSQRGLPHVFTGVPAMFGVMFAERLPDDYRGWASTDHELYDAVALGMIARGAMPEPDSREPWFVCEAHQEGDIIERVVTTFESALDAALEVRARGGSPRGVAGLGG